ncbi:MAG: hypothetical protein KJ732_03940 [Candidatus Margulisbacteria bacterium]|nr:hypothetical protein [Candidatus Margulisiibacteriota bacterium]
MATIVLFARYMGLKEIPYRTIEKLRFDPYFRYCFYVFLAPFLVYDKDSPSAKVTRQRLLTILKDPDAVTNEDLGRGLSAYLNNFLGLMPGGYKREQFKMIPDLAARVKVITDEVDRVLAEYGMAERANTLAAELNTETSYGEQIEFLKLSLKVFNLLVENHGFDRDRLWK